jgi:hypothetical protein
VPETHEERLRAAFKEAATAGQRAAVPAPPSAVRARGDRRRRQRLALIGAAACLLAGGTTASVVALLPTADGPAIVPATSPASGSATRPPDAGTPTRSPGSSPYPLRTYPPTGTTTTALS